MTIRVKRLNHVFISIPAGGEEKAREFYGKILGLEEIERPDAIKSITVAWYKINDIQLHIGVENELRKSRRHLAFEVEELEKVKGYMLENKVEIKDGIPIPGRNRFFCFDPFGNRIELLEMISSK